MVIKAAVRARLGIATGPDAQINSVDRLILRRHVPRQQCAEGRDVQVTLGQGRVETAPAAAVFGLQAEVGQGGSRFGCQQGVTKLEEGIGTSDKAGMQGTSEGAEGLEVMSGHGAQRARWPRRWPTRPTTAPPRVKSQAKSQHLVGIHPGGRTLTPETGEEILCRKLGHAVSRLHGRRRSVGDHDAIGHAH